MVVMEGSGEGSVVIDELVEAIAERVVELLEKRSAAGFATAAELAERFGVERSWVYAHAEELGVVRLGDGPRARLRFEPQKVARVFEAQRRPSAVLPGGSQAKPRRGRPRNGSLPKGVQPLLGRRERHSRP